MTSMTSKSSHQRRWRHIQRCVAENAGDIRVGDLARRFKLSPSNVSRGLKQRGIHLEPTGPRWDASSNPEREKRVEKRRKALALYLLGLNRQQIEGLLPIKSETLRNYILALTIEVRDPRGAPYRLFADDAMESLTNELEKYYGLGEYLAEGRDAIDCLAIGHFSADSGEFLNQFQGYKPFSTAFLMRKLRQILGTNVFRRGRFILAKGWCNRQIKVRAPQETE